MTFSLLTDCCQGLICVSSVVLAVASGVQGWGRRGPREPGLLGDLGVPSSSPPEDSASYLQSSMGVHFPASMARIGFIALTKNPV